MSEKLLNKMLEQVHQLQSLLQNQNQNRTLGSSTSKVNGQQVKTGYYFPSQPTMGHGPQDLTYSMGGVKIFKLSIFNWEENPTKHRASCEH